MWRTLLIPSLLGGAFLIHAAEPAFEAASIKASPPIDTSRGPVYFGARGGPGTDDPGHYTCTFCTVSELVSRAYEVPEYQIVSADRIPDDRFHIVATIADGTTREQFQVMLRSLLADRFHVKVHRESREMQVFRLIVSSGGPKLTPHKEETAPQNTDPKAGNHGPGFYYRVKGKSLQDFAHVLEGQLQKPLVDATGVSGLYDFDVWWSFDESKLDAPTLRSTVQSLGLKLESGKAAVEVVSIDHADRLPSDN